MYILYDVKESGLEKINLYNGTSKITKNLRFAPCPKVGLIGVLNLTLFYIPE